MEKIKQIAYDNLCERIQRVRDLASAAEAVVQRANWLASREGDRSNG